MMCVKNVFISAMLLAGNVYADTYNNLSIQGELAQPTPIYGVGVRVVSGGQIVGTGTDVDLLPDSNKIFSTQTYITDPWVFRTGEDYILRLSSPTSGEILSTFTITGVPFAHVVRGDANTGDQNIFASYGNAGIGTANPQYRLVVSSGGSDLMWVASDGVHATKFTGDGSGLTNVSGTGDNLGNHIASQTLQMGNYTLNSSSAITAAYYQIGGSTVIAKLPGAYSFAVGNDAGKESLGDYNTFVGNSVGIRNTTGHRNTFVGGGAGDYNTTGTYNTFIGMNAGAANTTGNFNTAVGLAAGMSNGAGNVNVGAYSASYPGGGNGNVTVGYSAGEYLNTWSYSNTLIGQYAGWDQTSTHGNVFVGSLAGAVNDGNNNIVIGFNQDLTSPSASSELNIGGVLFGDLSGKTIGISTRVPQAALDVVSPGTYAQIWRNSVGAIVSSMSASGAMMADRFIGDGSALSNLPSVGDNLGNHIATQTLNMAGFNVNSAGAITANSQITTYSSMTVAGNAFSVGKSTFVVNGGRVGLGTATPGAPLEISGGGMIINAANHPGFKANALNIDYSSTFNAGRIQAGETSGNLLLQPSGGKVGIGTTGPVWLLEVKQDSSGATAGNYPAVSVNNPNASGFGGYYFYSGDTQLGGMEIHTNTGSMGLYTNKVNSVISIGNSHSTTTFSGWVDIGLEYVSYNAGTTNSMRVGCPVGKKVLGGSCTSASNAHVHYSYPSVEGGDSGGGGAGTPVSDNAANGYSWSCATDGSLRLQLTAFAVCARVK